MKYYLTFEIYICMRHYHWIWFSSSSVTVSSESISWICLIHSETNWIEQWYDILYFHLPSASAPILIILSTRIFGVQSESKKDIFDFYHLFEKLCTSFYIHIHFSFFKTLCCCAFILLHFEIILSYTNYKEIDM